MAEQMHTFRTARPGDRAAIGWRRLKGGGVFSSAAGYLYILHSVHSARIAFTLLIILLSALDGSSLAVGNRKDNSRRVIVLVLDGLRPDSINRDDTPNLFRLRSEGVDLRNSHSVFPTVTRVNAAAISTGTYPARNGIVGNLMYDAEVNPDSPFNTADHKMLLKLAEGSGGRLLFTKSLGERLHEAGKRLAVVCSGSSGLSLLLNPQAPGGKGVTINADIEPGKTVAWPQEVSDKVLSRFGAAPRGSAGNLNRQVDWAEQVLRDHVLPELKPDVLIDWISEPDSTQHSKGVGSPEALVALRNVDRNIGLLLEKLKALGTADSTDVIVMSDHGFAEHVKGAPMRQSLIDAGLKKSAGSNDVVLASNTQSILVYVKDRDAGHIENIVRHLQRQPWIEAIFTPSARPLKTNAANTGPKKKKKRQDDLGWVPGTFSLELVHEANPERAPDIIVTLPWTTHQNRHGAAGASFSSSNGSDDKVTGAANGHGGLSPWTVRNTMIAWGPGFKSGAVVTSPSGNVDVVPTVLRLVNVPFADEDLDGRVLSEAFRNGPRQPKFRTRIIRTRVGGYRASVEISIVGKHRYINKAWR